MRTTTVLGFCLLSASLAQAPSLASAQAPAPARDDVPVVSAVEVHASMTITVNPPPPRVALTAPSFAPPPLVQSRLAPALVLPGFELLKNRFDSAAPTWGQPVVIAEEGPRQRTRWSLIGPGIAGLALGYLGWFGTAVGWNSANNSCTRLFHCTFSGRGPDGGDIARSLIPVVGPWLSVAESRTMRDGELLVPIAAGIGQAVGILLIVVGLATPETVGGPTSDDSDPGVSVAVDASPDAVMFRVNMPLQ